MIRMIWSRKRTAGIVVGMVERNAHTILMRKPKGKGSQGILRGGWMDNIKMDLGEIELGGMDRIDLAQDRDQWRALVDTAMTLRVQQNVAKFSSSCTTDSFSRRAQLQEVI
jgi:hypothetical protein